LDALKLDNLIEEEEDAMFLVLFCADIVEVVCVSSPETVIGRHIVLLPDNSPLKGRRLKWLMNVMGKLKKKIEMLVRCY
jgi:hypothetical protein